jgi:hypothetical protein
LRLPFAIPVKARALGPIGLRLLFALMGAFTGATLGWIGWGTMTPGDAFANGSPFVDVTLWGLGILGGYGAFKGSSRSLRLATTAASLSCAVFWVAVPDG